MKTIKGYIMGAGFMLGMGAFWISGNGTAFAHCDTLDGPVVMDAKAALAKGDVTPVLKWVTKEGENEIKTVFRQARIVRSKGPEAQAMADTYFFETLVRVHRAGEGAPFTGLKPAGAMEAPVAAADKALAGGSVDELAKEIGGEAEKAVRKHFSEALAAKAHQGESVEAGRAYVEAYVPYIHFVEGLHQMISRSESHHEKAQHNH